MEKHCLAELIDESIALELNIAKLYRLFSETFADDADFWWELYLEERSHAALIRAANDSFAKCGKFPGDLVAGSIEELKRVNQRITVLTQQYKATPPSRKEAFEKAIELEKEVGESHYMQFMDKEPETPVETVFQQLNRDDKDHEQRIQDRMTQLIAGT